MYPTCTPIINVGSSKIIAYVRVQRRRHAEGGARKVSFRHHFRHLPPLFGSSATFWFFRRNSSHFVSGHLWMFTFVSFFFVAFFWGGVNLKEITKVLFEHFERILCNLVLPPLFDSSAGTEHLVECGGGRGEERPLIRIW